MKGFVALALSLLVYGCATKPTLYAWGQYQYTIHLAYLLPNDSPPEELVELLEQDFQRARAANQRLPPGWHAHLAYLYNQLGEFDLAARELKREKAAFPESTVFVDRLLANMARP